MKNLKKCFLFFPLVLTALSLSAKETKLAPVSNVATTSETPLERKINFRMNPFALLFKGFNLEMDYEIGPGLTFGPSLTYIGKIPLYNAKGITVGMNLKKFFSDTAFSDAWFLGGEINYTKVEGEHPVLKLIDPESAKFQGSGLFAGAKGGYQWMWDRFNITLDSSLGVLLIEGEKRAKVTGGLGFSLGWAI